MKSSSKGYEGVVRMLLAAGAEPNHCDEYRQTALMQCCKNGHAAVGRLLIDAGARVNDVDARGEVRVRPLEPLMA